MVKFYLAILLAIPLAVSAGERKCLVQENDGSLSVRYADIAMAKNAKEVLQTYLDEEADKGNMPVGIVETCIEPWRQFDSKLARQVDNDTPR